MRRFTGRPSTSFPMVIGEVTTARVPFYARHNKILITDKIDSGCMGYLAILSSAPPHGKFFMPNMVGELCSEDIAEIKQGDIASVTGNGEIVVVWETGSHQNSLMLTESCNCLCKMCPQPPKKHDPALPKAALRTLDLLKGKHVGHICITGGEPTLVPDDFLLILRKCHKEHPEAKNSILTNAKKFACEAFTREVASASTADDLFCVSLHSDIGSIHDEIVGRKGSYNETQAGIYNLAKNRVRIEIRHVITKDNHARLLEFAEHMYRYFPFCSHYAFMSMEAHGLASDNIEHVYIDPIEYKRYLRNAVLALHKRGLHVSIYNTPLCLCHEDVRPFSRASISDWKNNWQEECLTCGMREKCCGFFSTSSKPISSHITPFLPDVHCDSQLIHKKPHNQNPSPILRKYVDELTKNVDGPILDVACGYGRNGAFLVSHGVPVIFIDRSLESLKFIEANEGISSIGSTRKDLISTLHIDLTKDDWPFEENSLSGIIDVHFYYKPLIYNFIASLKDGGFLYFESIPAVGGNYLTLPEYKYIITALSDKFYIMYYKEKRVKPLEHNVATITLLARKIG